MSEEQLIDIEKLTQDAHNFNKGTVGGAELMERSLSELGAGRSILIDKNGNIIAGNKTQEAAIKAGIKKVRVIETTGDELVAVKRTDIDINSKKGRDLAFVDNLATQINLAWDEAELEAIDVEGFDPGDWGWEQPTIDDSKTEKNTNSAQDNPAQEDDFDPDAKFEQRVQIGEIWQLGSHRLLCGDSTNPEEVLRLLGDDKADLLLTDPPYNVDYVGKTKDALKIQNDKKEDGAFRQFLIDAFNASVQGMKDGASFYIWHADSEGLNFRLAVREAGLLLKQCLIWNNNAFVMGRQDYHWKHEPCLYGWKPGASHNWFADRKQATVIDFDRPNRSAEHPTMKPVGLFGYQICNSCPKNGIVLDTFAGSGTAIIAAEQLERRAYCIELDPHYCNVIIARWESLTGQKAIKLNP